MRVLHITKKQKSIISILRSAIDSSIWFEVERI
jgi:hypothetical protein